MDQNLHIDFKPHDELSDTLSTSTASLNYIPFEDNSPSNVHSTNSLGEEVLTKSKKIRKKRNAYQKIDDDIRLKLLEAVQKGETLKSVAKRYNVNYSSAKSIFHIYRKEGRILKKATQDNKDFCFGMPPAPSVEQPSQFVPNPHPNYMKPLYPKSIFSHSYQQQQNYQPQEFRQERTNNFAEENNGSSSPLNGLVDNFSELLKIGNNNNNRPKEQRGFMPAFPSRFSSMMSPGNQGINKMQPNQQMSLAIKQNINQNMSPADKLKHHDFYMNYSNSPLSGNAKMIKDGSESGSNRCMQAEFESFSEMVNAFQNQNHLTDSLKDFSIPKLLVPSTMQPQEKFEARGPEDEFARGGTIENAALDTFKSFIDAQMVLNNAFMKAACLNNLVQIQKSKMDGSPSPKFLSFQGN